MSAIRTTALHRNALVRWVLSGQLVLTAILAGVAGMIGGTTVAVSLMIGGLIGFCGNLVYAWRAMRPEKDPGRALKSQLVAEVYKFAVTIGLFVLVFATGRNIAVVMLFVGFGTTFIIHWLAMLRRNRWMGEVERL